MTQLPFSFDRAVPSALAACAEFHKDRIINIQPPQADFKVAVTFWQVNLFSHLGVCFKRPHISYHWIFLAVNDLMLEMTGAAYVIWDTAINLILLWQINSIS